jgi:hypothetical protein
MSFRRSSAFAAGSGVNMQFQKSPFSFHPPDEFPSSFCQQPGSPGWPQQSWRFFSFIALFLRRSLIFSASGR